MPGDIAAATQQHKGKDRLAEGQQDDSAKGDEPDRPAHGLTLVSHSAPLAPAITTLRRRNSLRCHDSGAQATEIELSCKSILSNYANPDHQRVKKQKNIY